MRRCRKYSLMAAAGAVAATLMSMLPVSSASANTTSLTRYPY